MSNTILTADGRALIAQCLANGTQLTISQMIFADLSDDVWQATPTPAMIAAAVAAPVHSATPTAGIVSSDTVVYSAILDAAVGPFHLNFMALKSGDTVVAACAMPRHYKWATDGFQTGNSLIKNFALQVADVGNLTGVTIPAATWQYDLDTRYAAIDHTHAIAGKSMFEIFYSLSGETPPGAYPLWTGETITNCRGLYPDFWAKTLELADATPRHTGVAIKELRGDDLPAFRSSNQDGFVLTADSTTTGSKLTTSNIYYIFRDVGTHNLGSGMDGGNQFKVVIKFPNAANSIKSYTIVAPYASVNYPIEWALEGSNDNLSWDAIDYRSGQQFLAYEEKRCEIRPTIPRPVTDVRRIAIESLAAHGTTEYELTRTASSAAVESIDLVRVCESFTIPENFDVYAVSESGDVQKMTLPIVISGTSLRIDFSGAGIGAYRVIRHDIDAAYQELNELRKLTDQPISDAVAYLYYRIRFIRALTTSAVVSIGAVKIEPKKMQSITYEYGLLRSGTSEVYDFEIETYGETGCFVIDRTAGSIRLPTIKRFLRSIDEVSQIGMAALDQIVNIRGSIDAETVIQGSSGAMRPRVTRDDGGALGNGINPDGFDFDASRVVRTGDEVQPRFIATALYIQVYSGAVPASLAEMSEMIEVVRGKTDPDLNNINLAIALTNLGFSGSVSAGYQKLPGGMILQWGTLPTFGTTAAETLFPVAFPANCSAVVVTGGNSTPVAAAIHVSARSVSGFSVKSTSTQAAGASYIAIGY